MINSFAYFAIGFIVCLPLGLYAGKRRANGEDWLQIAREFFVDTMNVLGAIWQKISSPFRKGRAQGSAT